MTIVSVPSIDNSGSLRFNFSLAYAKLTQEYKNCSSAFEILFINPNAYLVN